MCSTPTTGLPVCTHMSLISKSQNARRTVTQRALTFTAPTQVQYGRGACFEQEAQTVPRVRPHSPHTPKILHETRGRQRPSQQRGRGCRLPPLMSVALWDTRHVITLPTHISPWRTAALMADGDDDPFVFGDPDVADGPALPPSSWRVDRSLRGERNAKHSAANCTHYLASLSLFFPLFPPCICRCATQVGVVHAASPFGLRGWFPAVRRQGDLCNYLRSIHEDSQFVAAARAQFAAVCTLHSGGRVVAVLGRSCCPAYRRECTFARTPAPAHTRLCCGRTRASVAVALLRQPAERALVRSPVRRQLLLQVHRRACGPLGVRAHAAEPRGGSRGGPRGGSVPPIPPSQPPPSLHAPLTPPPWPPRAAACTHSMHVTPRVPRNFRCPSVRAFVLCVPSTATRLRV
jgi:hypothetical protein